jgi:predicted membrane metal-binding protein
MNHFIFYSLIFLFNSYFIFDYLFRRLFYNIRFIDIILLEIFLFLVYIFLLFLFRFFLFDKAKLKITDYLFVVFIITFSFFLAYYNFKDYKYRIFQVLKNKIIDGYFEFQVCKIKSNYVILKVNEVFDEDYNYLVNTKVIIPRSKLEKIINNEDNFKNNVLIENIGIFAFASLEFVNQYNKKFDFYFSNNIFYRVNYFYDLKIKENDNLISNIRYFINKKYNDFEIYSNLLKGMVWGIDDFSYYEKQQLITSGLYHMFVASGGNISLVFNFSFYLLSFLYYVFQYFLKKNSFNYEKIKNNLSIILFSVMIVWFYSLIVGFDYPLLRAFLIAIITNLILFNYNYNDDIYFIIKLLFVLLIIFIILDYRFIYNLSFKMSFVSFMGICVLGSIFKRWILNLNFINKISGFWVFIVYYVIDSFVMSLSATIFLLPILVSYFGFVSVSGIFYNLIALAIYPIIFYLGIIYLIFDFNFIYHLIYNLLALIDFIVNQKQLIWYF